MLSDTKDVALRVKAFIDDWDERREYLFKAFPLS